MLGYSRGLIILRSSFKKNILRYCMMVLAATLRLYELLHAFLLTSYQLLLTRRRRLVGILLLDTAELRRLNSQCRSWRYNHGHIFLRHDQIGEVCPHKTVSGLSRRWSTPSCPSFGRLSSLLVRGRLVVMVFRLLVFDYNLFLAHSLL